MQIRFSWPNGVENVSNMFQSIQNIIINDRKYILDLYKWHKGRLKKSCWPPHKKIPNVKTRFFKKCVFWGYDLENWVWAKLALWICPILWISPKIGYTQISLTFFLLISAESADLLHNPKNLFFWKKRDFLDKKCALEKANWGQ